MIQKKTPPLGKILIKLFAPTKGAFQYARFGWFFSFFFFIFYLQRTTYACGNIRMALLSETF